MRIFSSVIAGLSSLFLSDVITVRANLIGRRWGVILETVLKSSVDASATASLKFTLLLQCKPYQVSRS